MAPVTNAKTIFAKVPTTYIEPGVHIKYDTSDTIDIDNVPLNGGVLLKTLVLSLDPYMRGKMRDPSKKSYTPSYDLGEPLTSHGIGLVLRSENSAFKTGEHVYGTLSHQQYSVINDDPALRVVINELGVPWSAYVGVLGMPGQTAYYGWKEFSKAQKGETAFISTAAGAVGSLVVQLAKLDGLKVIASSGSDEKVAWTREIGADVAFNYKTESTKDALEREGGFDIFWDNVGGETLDLALEKARVYGRFIKCGSASDYNKTEPYRVKNFGQINRSSLTISGLLVFRLAHKYEKEFYETLPRLVKDGTLKHQEDISHGLENVGQGLLDITTGANKGKKVIIVAKE
ncbi:alcohol dehydrogenase [Amylostereum chailletii]|nr:alcohol dehydrogenase [Amylostereum chailletii]